MNTITVTWVTNGVDRCIVGYVYKALVEVEEALNGRLGQVVGFWSQSPKDLDMVEASINHGGIVNVSLINYNAYKNSLLIEAVKKVNYSSNK